MIPNIYLDELKAQPGDKISNEKVLFTVSGPAFIAK